MANREDVEKALYEIFDEMNLERAEDDQLGKEPGTILFGEHATLDSMDLVQLVVRYEQALQEIAIPDIVLTDDRAWSSANSPFHTVASLVDYVMAQL